MILQLDVMVCGTNTQCVIHFIISRMPPGALTEAQGSPMVTLGIDAVIEFIFDANGNLTSETCYDHSPITSVRYKYQYEYDSKSNPLTNVTSKNNIEMNMNMYGNESLAKWISKNNVTKQTFTFGSGSVVTTYTYVYDSNGYPTKQTDNKGKVTEYQYK